MSTNADLVSFGRPASEKYVSIAEYGTEAPTSATEDLETAFESVLVAEDGVAPDIDLGAGDVVRDWAGAALLVANEGPEIKLEVPIISNTTTMKKLLYGSDAVASGNTFAGAPDDEWVVVITELRNGEDGAATTADRTVYHRCKVVEWDEGDHTRDDVIVHTVTFAVLYDSTANGYYTRYTGTTSTEEA